MARKPYNISSKTTTKKVTRRRTTPKKQENLETTTRIRIDNDRLNDVDSLDTSFLEGRVDAKSKKKVLNSKPSKRKPINLSILRNIISMVLVISLLVLAVLALMNHSTNSKTPTVKRVKEIKEVKTVDDNYLFVGDFHTNKLNFEDLDYHYTKFSDDDYTTDDIAKNIEDIYRYNPSIVFIQVGINDLNTGTEDYDIITNLSEIIDGIKKNREAAKIYVEGIYNVNSDVEDSYVESLNEKINNKQINSLNKKIEELTKDKQVEYLDINKEISVDDKLDEEYTDDGIVLNDKGYEKVLEVLRKVVDKNGVKSN